MPLRYLLSFFLLFTSISHAEDEINYHRLGWINKSDIQKLPLDQQPTIIKRVMGHGSRLSQKKHLLLI
jgi:hypothetical protein